jgi:hypothetical protein
MPLASTIRRALRTPVISVYHRAKYASGEIDRNGSITKAGDGAVREALVQAALTLLTRVERWSVLKAWGMAIAKRRGLRRAIVAVARKLAIVMHRIWVQVQPLAGQRPVVVWHLHRAL